jgi:glycosyltransferase involved in cell wall biosynthesis
VTVYIVRLPRFGAKTPEILQNVVDSIPVDKVDIIVISHEYGLYQNLEGGFYGGLKRLGKPICSIVHAVGNWDIDRVIATTSDRVVVHNEFMARRLGYPCVIIPHGCSPQPTPPAEECKKALGIDPRAPIVGYQGFISSYKGLETLIEAMRGVPEAALLIGGGWHIEAETQYQMQLKQWSLQALPGRCQWLGYVPDERLATVYGSMQIVVYPSRFITESGALLMALSHGKAVLASRLPPTREKEKLGALMTFRDVHDLTRKIKRLLKDEDARRKLEEGARAYAESVAWPKIARLHLSLYEDVLKRCGKD